MNRAQRRAAARRQQKVAAVAASIDYAAARARTDGHPFRLIGFTDACADCRATADITLQPDGSASSDIWHDEGCPAARGTVPWRAVS
jgi:hypothetical protein